MIEFMIIAAPRCGTTWAANWLTTDTTLCLHDPVNNWTPCQLDAIESEKTLGVSCTGLYLFPDWLNRHPSRKVILHRPLPEINRSLEFLGLPKVTPGILRNLDLIKGQHCDWRDLFDRPSQLYEFLLRQPFDAERHRELALIEMQPLFRKLPVNLPLVRQIADQLLETERSQHASMESSHSH